MKKHLPFKLFPTAKCKLEFLLIKFFFSLDVHYFYQLSTSVRTVLFLSAVFFTFSISIVSDHKLKSTRFKFYFTFNLIDMWFQVFSFTWKKCAKVCNLLMVLKTSRWMLCIKTRKRKSNAIINFKICRLIETEIQPIKFSFFSSLFSLFCTFLILLCSQLSVHIFCLHRLSFFIFITLNLFDLLSNTRT